MPRIRGKDTPTPAGQVHIRGTSSAGVSSPTLPLHLPQASSVYIRSPESSASQLYLRSTSPGGMTNKSTVRDDDGDDQIVPEPAPLGFETFRAPGPSSLPKDLSVPTVKARDQGQHDKPTVGGANSAGRPHANDPDQYEISDDDEYLPPGSDESDGSISQKIKGHGKKHADKKGTKFTNSLKAMGKHLDKPKVSLPGSRKRGSTTQEMAVPARKGANNLGPADRPRRKARASPTKSSPDIIPDSIEHASPPGTPRTAKPRRPKKPFFDTGIAEEQNNPKKPKKPKGYQHLPALKGADKGFPQNNGELQPNESHQTEIHNDGTASVVAPQVIERHEPPIYGETASKREPQLSTTERQPVQRGKAKVVSNLTESGSDWHLFGDQAEPPTKTKSLRKSIFISPTRTEESGNNGEKSTSEATDISTVPKTLQPNLQSVSRKGDTSKETTDNPLTTEDSLRGNASHYQLNRKGAVEHNSATQRSSNQSPMKPFRGLLLDESIAPTTDITRERLPEQPRGVRHIQAHTQNAGTVTSTRRTSPIRSNAKMRNHSESIDPFTDESILPTKSSPEPKETIATKEVESFVHPKSIEFIKRLAEKSEHETHAHTTPAQSERPEPQSQSRLMKQKQSQDRAAGHRAAVFQSVYKVTEVGHPPLLVI
ncbi:hypothetical protein GGS20DRAFT_341210 [Poronia punctata]|nr:hypothetical protein GGS20DRAFT_341210 [Poronia punctata]